MAFMNLFVVCIGCVAATRQVRNAPVLSVDKTAQLEKELDMIMGRVAEIKQAIKESKSQPSDEAQKLAEVDQELSEEATEAEKHSTVVEDDKNGTKQLQDVNSTQNVSFHDEEQDNEEPIMQNITAAFNTPSKGGAAFKAATKRAHKALRGSSADLKAAKHQASLKLERAAAAGMDIGSKKVKIHSSMKPKQKKNKHSAKDAQSVQDAKPAQELAPASLDTNFDKVVAETEKRTLAKLKKEAWKEKQAWHKKQKDEERKADIKKLEKKERLREAGEKLFDNVESNLNISYRARLHKQSTPSASAPQKASHFVWKPKPFFPAPENATKIAKQKKADFKKAVKAYKKQQKKLRMHKVGHELAKHARHPEWHDYDMLPMETRDHHGGRCDSMIPASEMGLKRSKLAARFWQNEALLQMTQEPEDGNAVSLARPGAGSVQIPADHGRSISGQVNLPDQDMVEPLVRVFKDGFYQVRCTNDLMYWEQDKYSYGKFRYKEDFANLSIVMYREMIVDSEWKAMTPIVCFEFCRTIPDMVFFGLIEGRECYCTPYYKPPTKPQGMEDNCDIPCEGDPTTMCGGKKKSLVFQMHFCADTTGALKESAMVADEMLSYMYDTAFIGAELTANLFDSGKLLKEYAGLSGLPNVADMGAAAEAAGMEIIKTNVMAGCLDDYRALIATYKEAKDMRNLDFTISSNLQKADDARAKMKELSMSLDLCTQKLESVLVQVYPLFHEFTELEGPDDLKKAHEEYAAAFEQYYPLLYVIDKSTAPKMSTCEGDVIGKPAVLTMPECAAACNSLVYPQKCMGYQYFQLGKSDELGPICFLFSTIKSITSYECPFVDDLSLIQGANSSSKISLRTQGKKVAASKMEPPICEGVRQSSAYSGLTCAEFYPQDSAVLQTCPDSCARTEGALLSATCQVKLSESTGLSVARDGVGRCFGVKDNVGVDQSGSEPHTIVPVGDSGPVMDGSFAVGTYGEMEDPMDFIWTRD
eukprot:gnl/MRDRNA2_/MRDRNA2_27350_c0_seq1.p1 gnl/MRDRNA2_/MRDRNA2_27350_c0~~gnl/MRDRNA2_/MRDRNA2_27350_c0_seq1.p1  ORF type:complete len:985 (-),score=237.08 gnl/MRDRNA2_/MRDRNA2_27350_c0_seq1:114-3068(-)